MKTVKIHYTNYPSNLQVSFSVVDKDGNMIENSGYVFNISHHGGGIPEYATYDAGAFYETEEEATESLHQNIFDAICVSKEVQSFSSKEFEELRETIRKEFSYYLVK